MQKNNGNSLDRLQAEWNRHSMHISSHTLLDDPSGATLAPRRRLMTPAQSQRQVMATASLTFFLATVGVLAAPQHDPMVLHTHGATSASTLAIINDMTSLL